jgi:hypothetical protein
VAAFAALCALLIAAVVVSSAGASTAKVLGKTPHTPPPNCPKTPCSAVGRVTGFPLVADGVKRPFYVRKNGKIVAWAIDLSKPTDTQRHFFGTTFRSDAFGTRPSARIAVLQNKGNAHYELKRQSPGVDLSGELGRRQLITLNEPLRVRKGQVVALTYPTWAPNFVTDLSSNENQWRGSRPHGQCSASAADIKNSRPHQKVDSVREYGCDYKTARLLYWAYFVPKS